jgi:hypothetical protein
MENYSSKICTKCYTPQEPVARYCDNCGKAFESTAATDGNISIVTKTFLKRQVAETRPLFWLCIIIVGMLGVFGFAQAGMYLTKTDSAAAVVSQRPLNFVSNDTTRQAKPQTVPMTSEEMAQPNDALDLNNSVFEMRDGTAGAPSPAGHKRKFLSSKIKTETLKNTTAETPAVNAPEKVEVPAAKPEAPTEKTSEKTADPGTAPKKYIRGPMGGCYYISASGSKRYVDRGLCS